MKFQNEIDVGAIAEQRFISLAKARGYFVYDSSTYDDIHNHIDMFLIKNDKKFSLDVKAMKKINRYHTELQDKYTYVELKNVNGKKGWLYGEAQFIAFERKHSFLIVQRKGLAEYCKKTVQREYVDRAQDSLYKFYQRHDRKDLITMIDLDMIPKEIVFSWDE